MQFIFCSRRVMMYFISVRKKKTLLSFILAAVVLFLILPSFLYKFDYTSHIARVLLDVGTDTTYHSRFIIVERNGRGYQFGDVSKDQKDTEATERLARLLKRSVQAEREIFNTTRKQGGHLLVCPKTPPSLKGRLRSPGYWGRWPVMRPGQIAAMFPKIHHGGHHAPTSCRADEKTAIVIPYQDRWDHLHTLLPVLIPMLIRQQIDFTIYVIEQDSSSTFNKGIIFNAGFLEAMNAENYDCFILHDVDMIPCDDRNIYKCLLSGPVHLSAGVDKFNYSSSYKGLFGGVVAFTRQQFQAINGASNMYFGWGAEDDDLRDRALNKGFVLNRKPVKYGVYNMIKHSWASGWSKNPDRFKVFAQRLKRQDIDGLNSVTYTVTGVMVFPIYTWISIRFDPQKIRKTVPKHLWKAKHGDNNFEWAPIKLLKT